VSIASPIISAFRPLVLTFTALLLLAGCEDNGAGSKPSTASAVATKLTVTVLGDEGPITAAKIEAKDASGKVVASAEVRDTPKASLTIPGGTAYPLIVIAYPEATPNEPLKAAVTDSQAAEQDISPVTTIVVDTALNLGGLTEANLAKAAGAAIAQRKRSGGGSGGGATTQSFKGDPTKQYGGWH